MRVTRLSQEMPLSFLNRFKGCPKCLDVQLGRNGAAHERHQATSPRYKDAAPFFYSCQGCPKCLIVNPCGHGAAGKPDHLVWPSTEALINITRLSQEMPHLCFSDVPGLPRMCHRSRLTPPSCS